MSGGGDVSDFEVQRIREIGVVRLGTARNVQEFAINMADYIRGKGGCLGDWTVKIQPIHGRLDSGVRKVIQNAVVS